MSDSLTTAPVSALGDVSLWRTLGALLLVLLLMVAVVWFLRRVQRGGMGRRFGTSLDMEIIGTLPLAQKQYLSVVRVGGQHWVLGITEQSVQYIGEYQGEVPKPKAQRAGVTSFATLLEKAGFRLNRTMRPPGETVPEGGA